MPILRILPIGLFALMLAFAFGTYAGLPPEVPTHFDFSGAVTGVRAKSVQSWFGLPFITLGIHLLLLSVVYALPKRPQLFNFPDKDRFLRLPRSYQTPVIAVMQSTLDLTSLLVMVVMGLVQVMMWRAAHGATDRVLHVVMLIVPVVLGPTILLSVSRVSTAVDAAERRWREDERAGRVR